MEPEIKSQSVIIRDRAYGSSDAHHIHHRGGDRGSSDAHRLHHRGDDRGSSGAHRLHHRGDDRGSSGAHHLHHRDDDSMDDAVVDEFLCIAALWCCQ